MIRNELFRSCLAAIPAAQRAEFEMQHAVADRIDAALAEKGMTQSDLAKLMNKRESEVSKWLTGRHNFTLSTIAAIETALGKKIINA